MTGSRSTHFGAALALVVIMLVSWMSSGSTATVNRKGTIKVIATITLTPGLPGNAVLTGTASAFASDFVGNNSSSASVKIPRAGNSKVVTVLLPYAWTLDASRASVGVSFSIDANTSATPWAQATITIPLPPDGAITEVRLPLTI